MNQDKQTPFPDLPVEKRRAILNARLAEYRAMSPGHPSGFFHEIKYIEWQLKEIDGCPQCGADWRNGRCVAQCERNEKL